MHQRYSALFVALLCCTIYPSEHTKPMVLTCEILKLIDGTSFGVTGHKVKMMLHIILKINGMLYGEGQGTPKVGLYSFNGKKYSIHELIELEKTYANDAKKMALLQKPLEDAKQDFDQKVTLFMKDAHGAKAQLCMLMEEACELMGRRDSFLLTWAQAQEGHEKDAFNSIKTFKTLALFCNDLVQFLKIMINSCPKAVAHYKELKAVYATQHGHKGSENSLDQKMG